MQKLEGRRHKSGNMRMMPVAPELRDLLRRSSLSLPLVRYDPVFAAFQAECERRAAADPLIQACRRLEARCRA